ncbi:MAG: amino acid permease [Bryobacterales bacterium]|nr:amino acid permease [Bryobacterales bacterium]
MANSGPGLVRALGIWSAASIVVGTVIGSGIFLVPKTMILQAGDPVTVLGVWIFGGILTLAGALTYAEMAAMLPEAGGEYNYLKAAYGPFWGFLYSWTQLAVAKSASIATLATGFFLYLANFRPELNMVLTTVPMPAGPPLEIRSGQLFAIGVILGLAIVNYFGVKAGGELQVVVTVIKVALIAGIIAVGLFGGRADAANYETSIPAPGGIAGFFAALVAALWAYDGWNNLGMVSSEVKDPQRNLPRAIILGTLAVVLIYLLTNVAYFLVLPASGVAASDRVAAEMMRKVMGQGGAAAVSVAAMISIFAALNGSILSGARVPYAAARDGLFLPAFSRVHPSHQTPAFSIFALSIWSCVLILSGQYDQLLTLVIFPSWILYGMATVAVIVLRKKHPDWPRPYRTLGYPVVPAMFAGVALILLGYTLKNSPRESGLGLIIIVLGLPVYAWVRRKSGDGQGPARRAGTNQ